MSTDQEKENERVGAGESSTLATKDNIAVIVLPNGMEVTEAEFGKPPADLPHEQMNAWYERRAELLMTKGYVEKGDET